MAKYTEITNRVHNFLQPEVNPETSIAIGSTVKYNGKGPFTVVSTQVLNTTKAMAIMDPNTGMVTKVFGPDLQKINLI